VFDKAKYINVKFDDIEITQHTKYDNLYAVTLKQTWRSSGYQRPRISHAPHRF